MFKNIYLTFFSVLSIISLSANANAEVKCAHTLYGNSYNNELPMDTTTDIIRQDTLLTPKGKLECEIYSALSKSNHKSEMESGSINNIMYKVHYSDGSGRVQGLKTNTLDYAKDESGADWYAQCTEDEMDDSRWCSLDKGDLRVAIWKNGTPLVRIGYDETYPGSNVTIRIDKGKPITASEKSSFTRAQSGDIINALKSGKSALTRYRNLLSGYNVDRRIDLYGFTEAWSSLNSMFNASVPTK